MFRTKTSKVNGHVESRYDVRSGNWTRPKFVQDPKLHIHGLAPGLNYGMLLHGEVGLMLIVDKVSNFMRE